MTWLVRNIVNVVGIILAVIAGFFTGTTRKENDRLNQENESLRLIQKRRVKRDSDSDADIINRLRADERKE